RLKRRRAARQRLPALALPLAAARLALGARVALAFAFAGFALPALLAALLRLAAALALLAALPAVFTRALPAAFALPAVFLAALTLALPAALALLAVFLAAVFVLVAFALVARFAFAALAFGLALAGLALAFVDLLRVGFAAAAARAGWAPCGRSLLVSLPSWSSIADSRDSTALGERARSRRCTPSSMPSRRCDTDRSRRVSRSMSAADGMFNAPIATSCA